MRYNNVVSTIIELCNDKSLSFSQKGIILRNLLQECNKEELLNHLDFSGVIPECFGHDSTEEKLYAKYCDELVALALGELDLKSHTIEERANAADVQAQSYKYNYTMVADSKAFRLSRTAKNQKDFKIESLNQWRHGADYALLVAPYYQYPNTRSQIYSQAIRYNVTLLSYTYLAFMLRSENLSCERLESLWQISGNMEMTNMASIYWAEINETIFDITGKEDNNLIQAINKMNERLKDQAKEQINYWQEQINNIRELPHQEAVEELIRAKKIDDKVSTIKRTADL